MKCFLSEKEIQSNFVFKFKKLNVFQFHFLSLLGPVYKSTFRRSPFSRVQKFSRRELIRSSSTGIANIRGVAFEITEIVGIKCLFSDKEKER